jgi:hypothetical protein
MSAFWASTFGISLTGDSLAVIATLFFFMSILPLLALPSLCSDGSPVTGEPAPTLAA